MIKPGLQKYKKQPNAMSSTKSNHRHFLVSGSLTNREKTSN